MFQVWKQSLESKGLRGNLARTKVLVSRRADKSQILSSRQPCSNCRKGVDRNSIKCTCCELWTHKRCSRKQCSTRKKRKENQELWNWFIRVHGLNESSLRGNSYGPRLVEVVTFHIFLLRALMTPTKQDRCGLGEDQQSRVCGERGTLAHIFAGCRIALSQDRYK